MKPAIVTFAASGTSLAERLAPLIGADIHHCGANGEDGKALLPRLFADGRPIIGICAAGILVRLLAPSLVDKQSEPPVIALSQEGAHVVPLLGGHHGANRLAREIAEHLGQERDLATLPAGGGQKLDDIALALEIFEFAQRLVHPVAAAAIKRALQDNIAHQMDCRRDIRSARCGCGQLLLALPVRRHAFTPCAVLRARAIQAAPSCPW